MKLTTFILVAAACLVLSSCAPNPELPDDYLKSWAGEYSFFEFQHGEIGSPHMLDYLIDINKYSGSYYATVTIDGWQTMIRARAIVQGDSESIELIFDSFFPDNMHERFSEGDILLTFTRQGDEIITAWGRLQPMIIDNEKTGIHFELLQR